MIDDQPLVRSPPYRGRRRVINDADQWIGHRGSVDRLDQSIGIIYASGLTFPNDYDRWDFNTTTDLSEVPDVTANVQAAVNAIQASGQGGVLQLPPGILRIEGSVTVSGGGVTIRGAGWEEYNGVIGSANPAQRGRRGTYILTTKTLHNAFVIAPSANSTTIENLAFLQLQPNDTVGFPYPANAYPHPIWVQASGSVLLQQLLFWGCADCIRAGNSNPLATMTVGHLTMRDITSAHFSVFASIDSCTSFVATNCSILPDLLGQNPNMLATIKAQAGGINLYDVGAASISSFSIKDCFTGIELVTLGGHAGPKQCKVLDAQFSGVQQALVDAGTGTKIFCSGIRYDGTGALGVTTSTHSWLLFSSGVNTICDIVDVYGTNSNGAFVHLEGTGCDVRLGPQCWFDNWNLHPPVTNEPNPTPALLCLAGNQLHYSTNTRFTNANGGPNTAGGGTITTY